MEKPQIIPPLGYTMYMTETQYRSKTSISVKPCGEIYSSDTNMSTVCMLVAILVMTALVLTFPAISSVFAVPPDDNWGVNRGQCENTGSLGLTTTCCWREPVPGKLLADTYCQTCTTTVSENGATIDCSPKELQMELVKNTDSRPLLNEGISEDTVSQPPPLQTDQGTIVNDDMEIQEMQQFQPSNNEREGQSSSSTETLSDFGNSESMSSQKENDNFNDNSEQLPGSLSIEKDEEDNSSAFEQRNEKQ